MAKYFSFRLLNCLFMIVLMIYVASCGNNDLSAPVDCSTSDLSVRATSQSDPTGCTTSDGSIAVEGAGGTPAYQFAINGGAYGSTSSFTNLGAGTHTIKIKDGNECERSIEVKLTAPGTTLAASISATSDSECVTNNGKLTVEATGGVSPYQYKIGTAAFAASATFDKLQEGNYTVTVKDNAGCTVTINSSVAHGATGVSFASQINPILKTNCTSSNCHGSGSSNGDWTKFSAVNAKAALIRNRTADKSMPQGGSLTADEIALIACWVNDGALEN